jgi:predicted GH43/DUF377 family glycosyl hydrolase
MKSSHLLVPAILLIGFGGYFIAGDYLKATFTVLDDEDVEISEDRVETGELTWVVDEGYRIDYASNPRIMGYTDGVVKLAYEYQAKELINEPGAKAYIAYSDDGLDFEEGEQSKPDESKGDGILFEDGSQRRYFADEDEGVVVSQSSTDGGETWEDDEGFRYDLNEIDNGWMGVRTVWIDEDEGVSLIYNTNGIDQTTGTKDPAIVVRLAYSEPGDMGMNFTLVDDNLIEEYGDNGEMEMVADPVVVVLDDGRVRLIFMRQAIGAAKPPKGQIGEIFSYISEDGVSFEFESSVVSWDDFDEWDVRSLNDPKIMELDDGRFRVYVAAMVPDPEFDPENPGEIGQGGAGYKWILVSITSE